MAITKSLIVLAFLVVLSTGFGVGTWAMFSDDEASTADQMASGTLDLKTDDADGVSQTLYNTAIVPGNSLGPATIVLKNTGSLTGSSLDISFSYVNSDGVPNIVEMTANETAAIYEVTTLTYDSTDLLISVNDSNVNGYKDIQDVASANLSGQSGLDVGTTKDFTIEISTDNGTSTDYANDGITVTMNFTLNQ
jgi:hypothetical protein